MLNLENIQFFTKNNDALFFLIIEEARLFLWQKSII